jgi:hypothetical protein
MSELGPKHSNNDEKPVHGSPHGFTVKVANLLVVPVTTAVILVVDRAATVPASTLKVPVVAPPGMVIDVTVGAATAGDVDDRLTTIPPVAAGVLSVIVPVDVWPERTVVGERATDDTALGRTLRFLLAVLALKLALTATDTLVELAAVVMANTSEVV